MGIASLLVALLLAADPAAPSAPPPAPALAGAAATPGAIATAEDLGEFVTGYLRAPAPGRLVEWMRAADRLGVLGEGTIGPFAAFGGAVLREHPELVGPGAEAMAGAGTAGQVLWWQAVWTSGTLRGLAAIVVATSDSAPVRDALEVMRSRPAPDPLLAAIDDPGGLDLLWASWFGSGDVRYLLRAAAVSAWEDDADPARRRIALAARWSLRSNADADPRTRAALEAAAAAGGAEAARLRAILEGPAPAGPAAR
jgi:hypothetical protein